MKPIYGAKKYKCGYCHVFALALHRVFGYQIAMIEDKDRYMWSDEHPGKELPYIPHVFCIKNGYTIDAIGVRKISTTIRACGEKPIKHAKIHKIDPRSLYHNNIFKIGFEKFTEKDIQEAEQFILKHKEHYEV
jgi:hypothetical protein